MMKKILLTFYIFLYVCAVAFSQKIDRVAVLGRNNPHVTAIDSLSSLSVGNGEFAFTCDVTGMQTFPELYRKGVPLNTMAQWGWHSFPNPNGYKAEEVLRSFDFGRGRDEVYSCQFKTGREKEASDYLRANPHRLNLATVGFRGMRRKDIGNIDQTLDLYSGKVCSHFEYRNSPVDVTTACSSKDDAVLFSVKDALRTAVEIRVPYPTGVHSDDASDWSRADKVRIERVGSAKGCPVFRCVIDDASYYIKVCTNGTAVPVVRDGVICIVPKAQKWDMAVCFSKDMPNEDMTDTGKSMRDAADFWNGYWQSGAFVDFGECTDSRAKELERRVILSQYLTAIQCAGSTPPQETGLTYNSWFGKFHLEMIWWHQAHFALWGHPEMIARTLPWYENALDMARQIARRQGFKGARWMKMTDPSAEEAPSNVGSFLIWQQPHLIYLCELLYRATDDREVLRRYAGLVDETAQFMADFAVYDKEADRYVLKGCIPAQETLKAAETVNPPFELSYWHYGLSVAQAWRERRGLARKPEWDMIISKLSDLSEKDGVYAAAESAVSYNSKTDSVPLALYSDHMAVLAAYGVLPYTEQLDTVTMKHTLDWVMKNWNWDKTWGWDYPVTSMNAVRCGDPEAAIDAILMDKRTNTYLVNGHNYQDGRLRCYLPGNGGLLTAVALMCAGWDGCDVPYPGFPKNGKWNVRSEGLLPMP